MPWRLPSSCAASVQETLYVVHGPALDQWKIVAGAALDSMGEAEEIDGGCTIGKR